MSRYMRVALPIEIADELVDDGLAVRPLGTRGGPLGESISIAVEAINTGSALVSISIAAVTCKRLAAAALLRRNEAHPDELTISINANGSLYTLQVDRTAPDAEDEALDFFITALNVK